ncbi:hypothetical protein G6F37_004556 [Rhizopus arrhizus]|nr:hypothetical protein G6F38_004787 [Rhizopus arrhizus]KAG1159810.1 hypothetical protein G6F37_004556 [Rhizopus arrhizus]
MVATHSQGRSPLSKSSVSHSNDNVKSKRRPSYRKSSEKYSISTGLTGHRAGITNVDHQNQQKRRSRSVCAGIPPSQHNDNRRPSAPATGTAQNLSIAHRFMSPKYPIPSFSASTSDSSTATQANDSSPVITHKLTKIESSFSSESCTIDSARKLSVAERFMNNSSIKSSSSSLSTYAQESRKISISSSNGAAHTADNPSSSDSMSGRLTIAEAFMKTSNCGRNSPKNDSMKGNLIDNNHPKENSSCGPQGFDINEYLRPSSDLDSALNIGKTKRIWGSQDTLVHQQNAEHKKNPIYLQFVETEESLAMHNDNWSFSSKDYFTDVLPNYDRRYTNTSCDNLSKGYCHESECNDYVDIENGYEKADYEYYCSEECKCENECNYWRKEEQDRDISSNKRTKEQTKKPIQIKSQQNDEIENAAGFWLGCCFISCGQRSDHRNVAQSQSPHRNKAQSDKNHHKRQRRCGRRGWVICIFLFLIIFVLVIYFIWPRTPLMRIEGASLTTPAKMSETKQGAMVGNVAFESDWLVNITVDNRQNHVPTRLVQVQVVTKDALTGLVIGRGLHNNDPNPEPIVLPPNSITTIQIPIHVDYQARDSTDTTFLDLIRACAPKHFSDMNNSPLPINQNEALPLHFWITLHFFGLDWLGYKPTIIATPATGGFACPQ